MFINYSKGDLLVIKVRDWFGDIRSSIFEKGYGIAVRRGHPIRDEMSMKILEMQDNGELAKMKHKWLVHSAYFWPIAFDSKIYNFWQKHELGGISTQRSKKGKHINFAQYIQQPLTVFTVFIPQTFYLLLLHFIIQKIEKIKSYFQVESDGLLFSWAKWTSKKKGKPYEYEVIHSGD